MFGLALVAQLTHDSTAMYPTKMVVKFADDNTVVGFISENDDSHYTVKLKHLIGWCSENNTVLNTIKTKEVIVDFKSSLCLHTQLTYQTLFLRKYKKTGLPPQLLTNFYRAAIESILALNVLVWYESCTFTRQGPDYGG